MVDHNGWAQWLITTVEHNGYHNGWAQGLITMVDHNDRNGWSQWLITMVEELYISLPFKQHKTPAQVKLTQTWPNQSYGLGLQQKQPLLKQSM